MTNIAPDRRAVHAAKAECIRVPLDVTYDFSYAKAPALDALYHRAQNTQWIAETRLPWHFDVDLEKPSRPEELEPLYGSDVYAKLSATERVRLRTEISAWSQSQFLHGEQGALLAAAQLVCAMPDTAGKAFAASQAYDEARHVAIFERYLVEKIGISYPINPDVKRLDDMVLSDSRWDIKLLGMQIVLEGLALAAFALQRDITTEPLLKALTTNVVLDEARHTAFGVLALRDYYQTLSEHELKEREDIVYEAVRLMQGRFLFQEVWEKLGLPMQECLEITRRSVRQQRFRQALFSKVVPSVNRVGLLSARQRERFRELGIMDFAVNEDPIEAFEVADRALLEASREEANRARGTAA